MERFKIAKPSRGICVLAIALAIVSLSAGWTMANGVFELPKQVLSGGASDATAAGGVRMRATLGQPMIGLSSQGLNDLCAGFWCGMATEFRIYLPFVLKNSLTEELVLAIRSAYLNETFLSARVSGSVRDYLKGREKADSHDNPIQKLTPREREVMQLIAEGHSNKEIAEMLNISPKTVDKHRSSMMSKIGVHDVASVVRLAIKYKLIFIDE